MRLSTQRETILKPLQAVIGVVERRQTMPVLANVLLTARDGQLSMTATDLEVELVAHAEVDVESPGEITVPGTKATGYLSCVERRSLGIPVSGRRKGGYQSGEEPIHPIYATSRRFPRSGGHCCPGLTQRVKREDLKQLLDKTHFSMAQQDVRYYLNGMLLETDGGTLRAVATDGHRLALCEVQMASPSKRAEQVIVPRKGVLELQRLLDGDGDVELTLGNNHVRAELDGIRFTSKLIDGRFPEYGRVVPSNPSNVIQADRDLLRHALQRAAILSNEKYRGIRMDLGANVVKIQANNPEQEEAEEILEVEYNGEEMEIGFNVNYLLDALGAVDAEMVQFGVMDSNSSCLIEGPDNKDTKFVVMPMRL